MYTQSVVRDFGFMLAWLWDLAPRFKCVPEAVLQIIITFASTGAVVGREWSFREMQVGDYLADSMNRLFVVKCINKKHLCTVQRYNYIEKRAAKDFCFVCRKDDPYLPVILNQYATLLD